MVETPLGKWMRLPLARLPLVRLPLACRRLVHERPAHCLLKVWRLRLKVWCLKV